MITIFRKRAGTIEASTLSAKETIPEDILWIDIYNPTQEEERSVEEQLGVEILTREETWKNQVLNRFYTEDGVTYMTAAVITKIDTPYPQTSEVTFIRSENYLLTLRYIMPTSFNNFAYRLVHGKRHFLTGSEVLEGLLEEMITRVAYNSEIIVKELDALSHDIFAADVLGKQSKNQTTLMKDVLRRLGASADLNSQTRESLHSLARVLTFFRQCASNSPEVNNGIDTLRSDVGSLLEQTSFLSDKITFQLDATLGVINVEQNQIVKVFTVLAVFFMPPTLISSIYGMNFHLMPELDWTIGYPFALSLMLASALIPFIYFRRKGWL